MYLNAEEDDLVSRPCEQGPGCAPILEASSWPSVIIMMGTCAGAIPLRKKWCVPERVSCVLREVGERTIVVTPSSKESPRRAMRHVGCQSCVLPSSSVPQMLHNCFLMSKLLHLVRSSCGLSAAALAQAGYKYVQGHSSWLIYSAGAR